MADSDNLSNRPNYAAFWASLAAILLVAGGPWLWFRAHPPAPPPAPPKPLASASFDDGVTVEILKAEVTARLVFRPPGPSVPTKPLSTTRNGISLNFGIYAMNEDVWRSSASSSPKSRPCRPPCQPLRLNRPQRCADQESQGAAHPLPPCPCPNVPLSLPSGRPVSLPATPPVPAAPAGSAARPP